MGHLEKNCIVRKETAKNRKLMDGQYGEWLRADQGRVRNKPLGLREQREVHNKKLLEGVGSEGDKEVRHDQEQEGSEVDQLVFTKLRDERLRGTA